MAKGIVTVAAVQMGPASENLEENIAACRRLIREAAAQSADFVLFPEMCLTPYFPTGSTRSRFYDWAQSVPGPAVDAVAVEAAKHGCCVILPLFERGLVDGEYYNSAVVIDRDGSIVVGSLPSGQTVVCARKNHLANVDFLGVRLNEAFYARPGAGYALFATQRATIGILICYDRWFPEGWRNLSLRGADIVFVPLASCCAPGAGGGEMLRLGMRVWSHQNLVFAVAANKVGTEVVERDVSYYGLSCIAHPAGYLLAQVPENGGPQLLVGECDLDELVSLRRGFTYFRDRREDIDAFSI